MNQSPDEAEQTELPALGALPENYRAFFTCFNEQRFFEAHEALEALWLPARKGPEADFYKGLIQLAGAFVHLQKDRGQPASALLKLALRNLKKYPCRHLCLDVSEVCSLIEEWLREFELHGFRISPLSTEPAPRLELKGSDH